MIKKFIKKIITAIKHPGSILYPNSWCNEVFVNYLRDKGMTIGQGTRFINPNKSHIDINRASYIKIGKNCCLSYASLIAHDYSWYTLLESCNDILPDSGGEIVIGDNCFIGYEALILKNTTIGDNVIIGARSVVKGVVPSNTVWAGVPARQICTVEELFKRKQENKIKDAKYRRDHIINVKGRIPTIEDMGLFACLFLERTEENFQKYISKVEFNGCVNSPMLRNFFFNSQPSFQSFDEFLNI